MSKAEDLAKEYAEKFILTVDHQNDVEEAYIDGYHQAEKDLELTWEDIKTIDKLLNQCVDYSNPYQEVLKRFKDFKERKEK
ncbi:hypothetical protein [Prevotella sp. E2-28]|uniref:hypothetical protein n=1 Tax=Prevotella sp. E2-28 TaxID=2913620 RepID=UPI001EDB1F6B|nr:hypothetical protein [Prevotella sp. E2-28]UKK52646.1 hypothetical protein L6465_08510 [Prevotella sp. E2-28]